MKSIFLFFILLLFTGCHTKKDSDKPVGVDRDAMRRTLYESFTRFVLEDDFEAVSYIFEESKPVANLASVKESEGYRFLELPSFDHPILITVLVKNNNAQLNLRMADTFDKAVGRGYFKLLKNKDILLSKEQLEHLRNVVNENPFWEDSPNNNQGYDGSEWFVEVKQQGAYHKGRQWTPSGGKIWNIGQCLLELSQSGNEFKGLDEASD